MPSVSEPGYFCTNGMSESRHDSPFANSGLVVTIDRRRNRQHAPAGRRPLPAAVRTTGVSRGRPVVRGADPVGPRLPRRPAQPGPAPQQLPPRDVDAIDLGAFLPEPVVQALERGLPDHGPAVSAAGSSATPPSPAPSRGAARPCGSSAIPLPGKARQSPVCIPAAKGPATPAGSSAPPWTASGPRGARRRVRPPHGIGKVFTDTITGASGGWR